MHIDHLCITPLCRHSEVYADIDIDVGIQCYSNKIYKTRAQVNFCWLDNNNRYLRQQTMMLLQPNKPDTIVIQFNQLTEVNHIVFRRELQLKDASCLN